MNNLMSYNEAIRWYKNGKLEPDKAPIVKDYIIIRNGSRNFIVTNYGNIERDSDGSYHLINVKLYDENFTRYSLWTNIPNTINSNDLISIVNNGIVKRTSLKNLPPDIINRISNRIVWTDVV